MNCCPDNFPISLLPCPVLPFPSYPHSATFLTYHLPSSHCSLLHTHIYTHTHTHTHTHPYTLSLSHSLSLSLSLVIPDTPTVTVEHTSSAAETVRSRSVRVPQKEQHHTGTPHAGRLYVHYVMECCRYNPTWLILLSLHVT